MSCWQYKTAVLTVLAASYICMYYNLFLKIHSFIVLLQKMYIFGFYHNLCRTFFILWVCKCHLAASLLGLWDILSVCVHVTNIPGAQFHHIPHHRNPGDFGTHYFSPVPLPIHDDVNHNEYQDPVDLYHIMEETGSCFIYIAPRILV